MARSNLLVLLVLGVFFVISFVTNIIGPLMPFVIDAYSLSLTMAAFLPFSFFLAYGIVSIPAGIMVEHLGSKQTMIVAFALNFAGVFAFSLVPNYGVALASLFIVGMGMAALQVVINPLLRSAGGQEHFAFFSVLGQLVFGLASFVSPFVFSYLMVALPAFETEGGNVLVGLLHQLSPEDKPWISLYWIFVATFAVILGVIGVIKIPEPELADDEKPGVVSTYVDLLKRRQVWFFVIVLVAYVGTEQGLATFMSEFLNQVHGVDAATTGAQAVGRFWGLMSVGCLFGLILLKLLDSRIVLVIFSVASYVAVAAALYGSREVSLIAFPMSGFCISVMYSIIFSLALNSIREHHGSFSGILCTGIFGGALVPLVIGALSDSFGIRAGMSFAFVTIGVVLSLSFWARPLVNNQTIFSGRKLRSETD